MFIENKFLQNFSRNDPRNLHVKKKNRYFQPEACTSVMPLNWIIVGGHHRRCKIQIQVARRKVRTIRESLDRAAGMIAVCTVIDTAICIARGIMCKSHWPRNVIKFVTLCRTWRGCMCRISRGFNRRWPDVTLAGPYLWAPVAVRPLYLRVIVNKA